MEGRRHDDDDDDNGDDDSHNSKSENASAATVTVSADKVEEFSVETRDEYSNCNAYTVNENKQLHNIHQQCMTMKMMIMRMVGLACMLRLCIPTRNGFARSCQQKQQQQPWICELPLRCMDSFHSTF